MGYILGHGGNGKTAKLFFDPGTTLEYSTHGIDHAALAYEYVTGRGMINMQSKHCFVRWASNGGVSNSARRRKHGDHASHTMGVSARDLARIAYCMLREGQWDGRQVCRCFSGANAAPTHSVVGVTSKSFGRDARSWSHGWELPALEGGEQASGHTTRCSFQARLRWAVNCVYPKS